MLASVAQGLKQRAGVNMRIGNLSQAPIRSRNTFAFQMMRVFIVVTIAASGAMALSLSVEDRSASPDLAAAEKPHEGTVAGAEQALEPSAQDTSMQVAAADPLIAPPMDGGIPSAAAPEASEPEPSEPEPVQAAAPAPADPGSEPAAAATADADAPVPETQQADASASPPPVDTEMTGTVTVASTSGDPETASDLVDLNTASFEQLNTLRNAGPIGRAIIRHRPYASVEDLVKRKVLRRSVYERIKDQVTVR
ncbi:ComEA family DNA-binding protein [Microvirga makkahensis]|nr:helix-hairpin-helix domain-containing protein [Microvirga makkahensis]